MASETKTTNLDEFTASQPESASPDYLTWRDAKVRRVLADKEAKQPDYKPIDEIASRFRPNAR